MNYKYSLKTFLFKYSLILAALSSCLSIRPGGGKSNKKLYETFFVGADGTQYFIKPLIFKDNLNEELKLDLTFRYKDKIKDSTTINMSFISDEILKNIDSMQVKNDSIRFTIMDVKFMFSERNRKLYNSRFSTKTSLSNLENMFDNRHWKITVFKNGNSRNFEAIKSTKKKITKLDYDIFALF